MFTKGLRSYVSEPLEIPLRMVSQTKMGADYVNYGTATYVTVVAGMNFLVSRQISIIPITAVIAGCYANGGRLISHGDELKGYKYGLAGASLLGGIGILSRFQRKPAAPPPPPRIPKGVQQAPVPKGIQQAPPRQVPGFRLFRTGVVVLSALYNIYGIYTVNRDLRATDQSFDDDIL